MQQMLATLCVFVAAPAIVTLTALWLGARARARRAEAMVHQLAVAPALRGERPQSADLGNAVEAIAMEVERIGEGQRFLTRLLERAPREERVPPPRSITPH